MLNGSKNIPTTDTYTLKDAIKPIQQVIGFSSICASLMLIAISILTALHNPISYVQIGILGFSGRAESMLIWVLFSVIYLRQYYPYQFLFLVIPLFEISDIIWDTINALVRPCSIPIIITVNHYYVYIIVLTSLTILSLIIFKPTISRPTNIQLLIGIPQFIIYIAIGAPIISSACSSVNISSNLIYEIWWQIFFLFTFGNIFTQKRLKFPIRWYFN